MQGRRYQLRPGNSWARLCCLVALATLPGALATLPSSSARADSVRISALSPGSERLGEVDLPRVLGAADAQRYRRIFALQEAHRWAEATRLIRTLDDPLLVGTIEAERYLSPAYRASYDELRHWLAQYADEADAKAIYELALKRRPAGAPSLAQPVAAKLPPASADEEGVDPSARARLSLNGRRQASRLRREIRTLARNEPRKAELVLAGYDAKRLLTAGQRDELRTVISAGYLAKGKVREALMLSAAARSPASAATAHWQAGLAAWRLGRYAEAGVHFQSVVRTPGQSSWTIAAAAYWAARVELRNRHPELFDYWLRIAAEHPRTFYGLLAQRTLGIDAYFDFEDAPFTELDADMIEGAPAGRRALALLQLGETAQAEAELRTLLPRAHPALVAALMGIADRANMPGLSLQLAARAGEGDGRHRYRALYPVPRWTPLGGFTVDRALLFAVMRQESQFLPRVHSNAGAVGLMQLMPATAHAMAKRTGMALAKSTRPAQKVLAQPELNLALAQEYIMSLIEEAHIGDNLVLIAAAYNCGPGAVQHWTMTPAMRRDPLLFVESIPSRETRVFTERVLANYWIYRQRLGQPTPDLDALAAGQWPIYTAFDSTTEPDRRHAETRSATSLPQHQHRGADDLRYAERIQ
jgi:soluble lytic murein transglycosylase